MEIAVGTVIDERYEVLGRIGAGAVAVVYLARHLQIGSLHALKVLLVPTHAVQSRLVKEGRLQGTLRDRNVVAVTDLVDVHGSPGLVMEYVRGPSLERILQHVHFDVTHAVALGTGILLGARAAHQIGMVHRDLKPANVLIEVTDVALVPKIADFGLAKLLHSDGEGGGATRTGSTLGTPAYMAPEQIRDARQVDERADVFSLGALLYEILCGRRAFPGDDLLELYDKIREGRYAPIRSLVPEVPPELERVVDDALRIDKDQRISSVAELLDRWTGGRGESAQEIQWSPSILRIAADLVPDGGQGAPTAGASGGATFDLGPPNETASVEVFPPPLTPPLRAPLRRPRRLGVKLAAVVVVALGIGCLGGAGAVAVAVATGFLEPGPKAARQLDESHGLYQLDDVPQISLDPEVQRQIAGAWTALRQDRPDDALTVLSKAVAGDPEVRDDPGVRLLIATALLRIDDPRAYGQIQAAADLAKDRKGPVADLARLALDGIASGVDPKKLDKHCEIWPKDLLAPLLFASLDGWDADAREARLRDLIAADPDQVAARVILAQRLLERSPEDARAVVDEGLARFPGQPGLLAARAAWMLASGDASGARQVAEAAIASGVDAPETMAPFAGALRMQGDDAALNAVVQQILADGDDARFIAYARGRAEAAFGLGRLDEAADWLDRGFARATAARRFGASVDLFLLDQTMALLLGDRDRVARAWERGRVVAGLAGLPRGLRDRVAARLGFLDGVVGAYDGDPVRVQARLQDLRASPRTERLAVLLELASFGVRGAPLPDEAVDGCAPLALQAGWSDAPHADPAGPIAAYRALVEDGSPCGVHGVDRFVRARAEAALARLTVERDPAEARRHVAASIQWAPEPDLGSPIVGDRATALEALTWRDTP